jgi:uncharacterized membrane protein
MQDFLIRLVVTGAVMGILDFVWLTTMTQKFYRSQIGSLLLDKPNIIPALAFYIIYVIGVVVFVLSPALEKSSWQHALGYGALFGLVGFATYDLTNLSTLKQYPLKLALVDITWGVCLTAIVSVVAYWIVKAWTS